MPPSSHGPHTHPANKADGDALLTTLAHLTGRIDADGQPLGTRREQTRQRIVAQARSCLLDVGYRPMRVEDVARRADVTRPTLYAYFENKEHLLVAALAEEALEQLPMIAPLFDARRPAEARLRDWAKQTVAYVVTAPLTARIARDRDPEVLRVLTDHKLAAKALGTEANLDKGRLFSDLVQQAFPDAFTQTEANEIASMLRALSHLAPTLLDQHALFGLTVDRMAELLSTLLVDGMRAKKRKRGNAQTP